MEISQVPELKHDLSPSERQSSTNLSVSKVRFRWTQSIILFLSHMKEPSIFVGGFAPFDPSYPCAIRTKRLELHLKGIRSQEKNDWKGQRCWVLIRNSMYYLCIHIYMSFLCSEVFICSTVSKSLAVIV